MQPEITIQEQRMGILKVLEECVKKGVREGEKTGWRLPTLNYICEINKVGQLSEWREKSKLFVSIDYRSATYLSILERAKKALEDLKKKEFTFECSELIRSFMNLSPAIKGKRFKKLIDKDLIETEEPELKVMEEEVEEIRKEFYLREGATGKDVKKIIKFNSSLEDIEL